MAREFGGRLQRKKQNSSKREGAYWKAFGKKRPSAHRFHPILFGKSGWKLEFCLLFAEFFATKLLLRSAVSSISMVRGYLRHQIENRKSIRDMIAAKIKRGTRLVVIGERHGFEQGQQLYGDLLEKAIAQTDGNLKWLFLEYPPGRFQAIIDRYLSGAVSFPELRKLFVSFEFEPPSEHLLEVAKARKLSVACIDTESMQDGRNKNFFNQIVKKLSAGKEAGFFVVGDAHIAGGTFDTPLRPRFLATSLPTVFFSVQGSGTAVTAEHHNQLPTVVREMGLSNTFLRLSLALHPYWSNRRNIVGRDNQRPGLIMMGL